MLDVSAVFIQRKKWGNLEVIILYRAFLQYPPIVEMHDKECVRDRNRHYTILISEIGEWKIPNLPNVHRMKITNIMVVMACGTVLDYTI